MIGEDREKQYNPFAPAMPNSGGAMDAGIPQLDAAQQVAMADQGESVKEKATGLIMDKGMNYGVDKGAGALSKVISGIGAKAAGTAGAGALGPAGSGSVLTGATAAGKGGGMAAGMTGMAAAAAPALPLIIGAMALKSIFKK